MADVIHQFIKQYARDFCGPVQVLPICQSQEFLGFEGKLGIRCTHKNTAHFSRRNAISQTCRQERAGADPDVYIQSVETRPLQQFIQRPQRTQLINCTQWATTGDGQAQLCGMTLVCLFFGLMAVGLALIEIFVLWAAIVVTTALHRLTTTH